MQAAATEPELTPRERAALLMEQQYGVAHRRQLLECGMSKSEVRARLASGSWRELHPHVLTPTGAHVSFGARCVAAWLAVRHATHRAGQVREVAVTGIAGALLLGMSLAEPLAIDLVVPTGESVPDLQGVKIRRVKDWPTRRRCTVGGVVASARADAIADIARDLAHAELLELVQEQVFARRVTTVDLLGRCRRGRGGSAALRLAVVLVDNGVDSVLHERALAGLRRRKVPVECNLELVEGMGTSDCVVRRNGATARPWGFVLEHDGDRHRTDRAKHRHDRRKDRATHAAGFTPTLRFTAAEIDSGEYLDDVLAEQARQAALRPDGSPR